MKYLAMSIGAGITFALAMTAAAQPLTKDIAARIEAIPIQTLTISDEQFLKGDAYGKPTTIAGVLRVAQGPGRLPLVILVAGSGGFAPNADVWDRQFQEMGISTFATDSFAGRGIAISCSTPSRSYVASQPRLAARCRSIAAKIGSGSPIPRRGSVAAIMGRKLSAAFPRSFHGIRSPEADISYLPT